MKPDLFNIDIESPMPEKGSLLIAEPFLRETFFNHAVIAMIDCEEGRGSMGVVLNRSTGHTLDTLAEGISRKVPVFCGGPMSTDRLFYIHTLGDIIPGASSIVDDLFVGGDFSAMRGYVEAGHPIEGHIRFFIGYSGWDEGQLRDEMGNHVWATSPMPSDKSSLLTGADDTMWHRTVRALGTPYRNWLYHPSNPSMN